MSTHLTVTIRLGNDALVDVSQLAVAVEGVAARLRAGITAHAVTDANGDRVGQFTLVDSTDIPFDHDLWADEQDDLRMQADHYGALA